MKVRVVLIITCSVMICWLLSLSITKSAARFMSSSARGWQVTADQTSALLILLNEDEMDWQLIESGFADMRLGFKQTEMLLWYVSREYTSKYLNGAPLPFLEPHAPSLSIIEPQGLQVIEEQIAERNESETKKMVLAFRTKWLEMRDGILNLKPTDRMVLEALKEEVIRISMLEITGFENPAFTNAISEAGTAWKSLTPVAWEFALQVRDRTLRNIIEESLKKGNELFGVSDFETFDRLAFIRDAAQPLYGALVLVQQELGIEFYTESGGLPKALNEQTKMLFTEALLDQYYFTNLQESLDSKALQNLGKALFFDPILSSNNKRACASCHKPELAFTDGNAKSVAIDFEGTVDRNSPGLINAVFATHYFYDLRTAPLENQFEHVVFSNQEFNTTYADIMIRLNQSADYKEMFHQAFGPNSDISKHTITTALASYVASLNSFNSGFDRYMRGEIDHLEEEVKTGFNLFMGKANCGTCHFAPTFAGLVPPYFEDTESEILGVPQDTTNTQVDADLGRAGGTLKQRAPIYEHSFKTVSVRNIALTAPYMHNGVYQTLEQVIDFYNAGGGLGLGLEVPYQTLPADSLGLSVDEKKALIAFMHSLTDTTGLTGKPAKLPSFGDENLDNRTIGGAY